MGAAEDRDDAGTALVDRRELHAARKLAVRLLEMIGKLESQPAVDVAPQSGVRPAADPTAEDFAEVRARRRRRARRNG